MSPETGVHVQACSVPTCPNTAAQLVTTIVTYGETEMVFHEILCQGCAESQKADAHALPLVTYQRMTPAPIVRRSTGL